MLLNDDSAQLEAQQPFGFPVWPTAPGGRVGDSGIAALSNPTSLAATPAGSPTVGAAYAGLHTLFINNTCTAMKTNLCCTGLVSFRPVSPCFCLFAVSCCLHT